MRIALLLIFWAIWILWFFIIFTPQWRLSRSNIMQRLIYMPPVCTCSWRRAWQPTPVFLPGESHGRRSPEDYSPWDSKESDTAERLSTHNMYLCWNPPCQSQREKFLLAKFGREGCRVCNPPLIGWWWGNKMVFNHQPSGFSQSGVNMLVLSLTLSSSTWVGALVPAELRDLFVCLGCCE